MGNTGFIRKINFNNNNYEDPFEGCSIGRFLYLGCELTIDENPTFMQLYDENHNAIFKIYEDDSIYHEFYEFVKKDVLSEMSENKFPSTIHYFVLINDVIYRPYTTPAVEVVFCHQTEDDKSALKESTFKDKLDKYRKQISYNARECVFHALAKGEIKRK